MLIRFKRSKPDAKSPSCAYNETSAGWDLYSCSDAKFTDEYVEYETGIHIEIPNKYVGLIFPRSSISNVELSLSNSVGIIDHGFTGEIKFRFRITRPGMNLQNLKVYNKGDKIGQLIVMPYPELEWQEVEELSNTERGEDGFGSSGR